MGRVSSNNLKNHKRHHLIFTSVFTNGNLRKNVFYVLSILFISLSLNACNLAALLSTQYSENIALAKFGTEANHPGMIDGNIETVATVAAKNDRHFILRFADVQPVRKIIIHNENLFRFEMEYLNPETDEWETFQSVIQRRNLEGKRAQSNYVFDRLNFQTQMIRITVTRTVDDVVINKVVPDKGDRVVNERMNFGGRYSPHSRVIRPSIAQIREIEVYHLAKQ